MQRKIVTVLFCDVTGSTALGESIDPEALRGLLARYFERMKAIVEHHGGTVEKFIGDAVMAVFGVPLAHEDDGLRAVRAAAEMRAALPDLGVQARIGVNTGEVVTGTRERLATGDAINVAARLQQAAQPGEVILGAGTLALVREAIEVEEVEPLALKGKAEPVAAYRLVGVQEAPKRRHETRFVGRGRELALLREACERVRGDRLCEFVTVIADAGVGKSRLVAEALAPLDVRLVRGRCLPYGEGITYWPVVEVLKQLGVLPTDAAAAEAIRSLLGEMEIQTSAEEIAWAVRKTFEHAASERPLAVVFDDVHWGEETFLDLIEHVALLSTGAPILLACIARPELLERRPQWAASLRLEPLSAEDVEELMPRRVGAELRERIARAAGGNPLFITEMLAMTGAAQAEVVVPPTLQALLAARLDQLEAGERSVLERGAVEGEIFHRGAVQALAPDEPQVTPRLAALVRKQLIRPDTPQLPGEDGFRFRHLLIRDVAYDSLSKAARADLHERLAQWLEEHGGALVELHEILGYHLEQAYRYRAELGPVGGDEQALARRSATLLAECARRASARGDVRAQVNFLERATGLLLSDDSRLPLLLELASVAGPLGEYARTPHMLEEVAEAAAAKGDSRLQYHALLELTLQQSFTDPTLRAGDMREVNRRAIAVFEENGDVGGLARAWRHRGYMHQWVCEWDAEREAMERALAYAEEAQDEREARGIRGGLVNALVWGPTPVPEALERLEQMLADVAGRPFSVAYILEGIAHLRGMRAEFGEARRLLTEAKFLFTDLGLPFRIAAGVALFGAPVELWAGDAAEAEAMLREACDVLRAHGETGVLSTLEGIRAEALYRLGQYDEAERATRASEETASVDDVFSQAWWRKVRAKVAARRNDVGLALKLSNGAVECLRASDSIDLYGDVLIDRAEVLTIAGRSKEAAESVTGALRLYRQKGNIVSTERAEALLDEFSDGGIRGR